MHRDLKLDNILVHLDELTKQINCKLADLGEARDTKTTSTICTAVGTEYYMAPEISHLLGYTSKADIFSLGVLIHALLLDKLPFKNQSDYAKLKLQKTKDPKELAV